MKKYFLLFFLFGCVPYSPTRQLYIENGVAVYETNCSGSYKTMGDCMIEMNKQCPFGYNIITSSEKSVGSVATVFPQNQYNYNNPMNSVISPTFQNIYGTNNTYSNQSSNPRIIQTNSVQRYTIFSCRY